MALLVFLPLFYYSSPFGFAAFSQSVAVLCWSCSSCLVFARLLCCCGGQGGPQLQRCAGRVGRRGTRKQAMAVAQKIKIRWWNWGKTEVSVCFIKGYMTQSDPPLTLLELFLIQRSHPSCFPSSHSLPPVAGVHFGVGFHLLLCLKLCS